MTVNYILVSKIKLLFQNGKLKFCQTLLKMCCILIRPAITVPSFKSKPILREKLICKKHIQTEIWKTKQDLIMLYMNVFDCFLPTPNYFLKVEPIVSEQPRYKNILLTISGHCVQHRSPTSTYRTYLFHEYSASVFRLFSPHIHKKTQLNKLSLNLIFVWREKG